MPLLSVAEALTLIEQHAKPLAATTVPLEESLGLTLAEDVISDVDSPPHTKAMMDGYAIIASDDSPERRVLEEVTAGSVPTKTVTLGQATRIMTGAPMPEGADAVVPVEQTQTVGDGRMKLLADSPVAGKHVMPQGESMRMGQTVVGRGSQVRSIEIAVMAEVGHAAVQVIPQPTVGVLPTGSELAPVTAKPGPGCIRNTNGPMLLAAVAEAGAAPVDVNRDAGPPADTPEAIRDAILSAADCDVLLLSGGVSAGTKDLVPGVLQNLGARQIFHKVAVKPGKPIWFGLWTHADGRETYVFGLPGNPVSSLVCFAVFVRPLLAVLAGRSFGGLLPTKAHLADDLTHRGGREMFLPVSCQLDSDGERIVQQIGWRGSADLAGLVAANALLRLPIEPVEWPAGEPLDVLLLPR